MTDTLRTDDLYLNVQQADEDTAFNAMHDLAMSLELELIAEKEKHEAAASFAVGMDHANAGLMADLEDAREQLAAAQRDAERYRLLRVLAWKGSWRVEWVNNNVVREQIAEDALDAAIDTAMKEGK